MPFRSIDGCLQFNITFTRHLGVLIGAHVQKLQ